MGPTTRDPWRGRPWLRSQSRYQHLLLLTLRSVQFISATATLASATTSSLAVVPLLERLQPIFETGPEIDASREDPGELIGEITVRDLEFCYTPNGRPVFNGLSLDVKPGQFIAIVGASGCGKSTLVRLLLGFETPTGGSIALDGKDLQRLDLRRVRQQIGAVLQAPSLLPGSLYENVAGSGAYSYDEVSEALAKAGFGDDLTRLPMGLDTIISEGGGSFSGGQRQRIMIARALIKRPRILLLDEATSALDNESE